MILALVGLLILLVTMLTPWMFDWDVSTRQANYLYFCIFMSLGFLCLLISTVWYNLLPTRRELVGWLSLELKERKDTQYHVPDAHMEAYSRFESQDGDAFLEVTHIGNENGTELTRYTNSPGHHLVIDREGERPLVHIYRRIYTEPWMSWVLLNRYPDEIEIHYPRDFHLRVS